MNKIRCALCNSQNSKVIHTKAGVKRGAAKDVVNVICTSCGLMYNSPQPQEQELSLYYTGGFIEEKVGSDHSYETVLEHMKNKKPLDRMKKVVEYIRPFLKRDGSVCDIGCSRADLLYAIQNEIPQRVVGVEPDPTCVRVAKEFYGLKNVYQGFFEDYISQLQSEEKFDMVIMRHVLEHMKDINETIVKLKSITKENGYIFLAVPDCGNLLPYRTLDQVFEYGHLYSFTPATLHQILWKHGLKVVKWTTDYHLHLQVICTPIENSVEMVPMSEFKKWFSISAQIRRLSFQKYRRNFYRIMRRLGKDVQPKEIK